DKRYHADIPEIGRGGYAKHIPGERLGDIIVDLVVNAGQRFQVPLECRQHHMACYPAYRAALEIGRFFQVTVHVLLRNNELPPVALEGRQKGRVSRATLAIASAQIYACLFSASSSQG